MNRKVYLLNLRPSPNHIPLNRVSGPVTTPENVRTICPGIWEEIANILHTYRQTNGQL